MLAEGFQPRRVSPLRSRAGGDPIRKGSEVMSGQIDRNARTRALVLTCLAAIAPASAADGHTAIGWVLANQPNATAPYTPTVAASYNSSGGSITITNGSTGIYQVNFGSLYNKLNLNNVQVVAAGGPTGGATSGYCLLLGWNGKGTGNGAQMDIGCVDANGNLSPTQFFLEYQQRTSPFGSSAGGIAFLYADQPTAASYTPNTAFNFNSTGTSTNQNYATVVRNSTGSYSVTIPGLESVHSDVQVTALSNVAPARCKVGHWLSNGNGGTSINVLCFNSSGSAADEYYSLAYSVNEPFGLTSSATARGAWARANCDTCTTTYTPSAKYQYSGFATGKLTSVEGSAGSHEYRVAIPGSLTFSHSHEMVTAYGDNSDYCNIDAWLPQTAEVNVACYAQGGAGANSDFGAVFQTEE